MRAVATAVLVVLAVSGCTSGGDEAAPVPPAPATASSTPIPVLAAGPTATRPPGGPVVVVTGSDGNGSGNPDRNHVLGPTGWQGLDLGTAADEAAATGLFVDPGPVTACDTWSAVGAAAIDSVQVSGQNGVEAISAAPGKVLETPEGLRVGWTAAQVARTYPPFSVDQADPDDPVVVAVPQNPEAGYRIRFDDRATVVGFDLVLLAGVCT